MKKYIDFFKLVAVLIFSAWLVQSCKLKSIDPASVDIGYDYIPLQIGNYIIYDEHDIVYDATHIEDTLFNVKELIYDTIVQGTETRYLIYHFTKKTTDSIWPIQPDSVWTYEITGNQLIREESNIEYVKLLFPVQEGKSWNGNAYNLLSDETSTDKYYSMSKVNMPYTISPLLSFSETLTLTVANQSDPIVSKDIRLEVYAKGIGLIQKDYTTYFYKQDNSPPQTIDYGSHKVMNITSYGKQ